MNKILIAIKKIRRVIARILAFVDFSEKPFYTKDVFKNKKYYIDEFTYGNPIIYDWNEGANLKVGKFCSFADDVKIFLGGNHRTDWITTYPFNIIFEAFPNARNIKGHPSTKGDVTIGNDVWIGKGASIMSGVTIGDGAVIGAYSVITKNINPYEIYAGNPAKLIRKRFDDDIIKALLCIQWWNWPKEKINQQVALLCDNKINNFIENNAL